MFDWQTDEDEEAVWQEEEIATQYPRRMGVWLGVVGLLVVLAGGGWWGMTRFVDDQTEQLTRQVDQDIFASHTFIQDLLGTNDRELFVTYLSGRDAIWTRTQADLFSENLALHNAPRPVGLQPHPQPTTIVSHTLSADLRQAVLLTQHTYTETFTGDVITLQQQLTYRRGQDKWLLSPPDESFWGNTDVRREPSLMLYFPERDAEISRRLAEDFDRISQAACADIPDLACDAPLTIHFRPDPAGLLDLTAPNFLITLEDSVVLPTPSLIGLPIDEAGYQALLRAYTPYILAGQLNQAVGWECCRNGGGYEALLIYQLSQLGVVEWPLSAEAYLDFAFVDFETSDWQTLGDVETVMALQALVQYTIEDRLATPRTFPELADTLINTNGYWSWLGRLGANNGLAEEELIEAIQQFILQQMRVAEQTTLPLDTRPEQDLAVMCHNPLRMIYRYSFAINEWQEEYSLAYSSLAAVGPLPDDSGYLLTTVAESPFSFVSQIVQNGQEYVVSNTDSPYHFYASIPELPHPAGDKMHVVFSEQNGPLLGYATLDYASCLLGSCDWQLLAGLPAWSPTGDYYLANIYANNVPLTLNVVGGMEPTLLGQGANPFWLDEETFGHFVGLAGSYTGIRLATVDNLEPVVLLRSDEVVGVVPARDTTPFFTLIDVIPIPNHDAAILLAQDNQATYFFRLEKSDADLSWRESAESGRVHLTWLHTLSDYVPTSFYTPYFPSEQQLALQTQALANEGIQQYLLLDWQTGTVTLLPPTRHPYSLPALGDWSADGKWFARPGIDFIHVLSPNTPYQQHIFPPGDDCTTFFWLNQ